MYNYRITVRGKGSVECVGTTPIDAFEKKFSNITLKPIDDAFNANVCIELLNGKKQSKHYYVGTTRKGRPKGSVNKNKPILKGPSYIAIVFSKDDGAARVLDFTTELTKDIGAWFKGICVNKKVVNSGIVYLYEVDIENAKKLFALEKANKSYDIKYITKDLTTVCTYDVGEGMCYGDFSFDVNDSQHTEQSSNTVAQKKVTKETVENAFKHTEKFLYVLSEYVRTISANKFELCFFDIGGTPIDKQVKYDVFVQNRLVSTNDNFSMQDYLNDKFDGFETPDNREDWGFGYYVGLRLKGDKESDSIGGIQLYGNVFSYLRVDVFDEETYESGIDEFDRKNIDITLKNIKEVLPNVIKVVDSIIFR